MHALSLPPKTILLVLFLLLASFSHANDQTQKVPAVWAWKISSEKRTIYLLGEVHAFKNLKNQTIDYQLGTDIYMQSSEIWTEFDGTDYGGKNSLTPLSALLNTNTWERLKGEIRGTSTKLILKKGEETDQFIEKIIQNVDQSDASYAHDVIEVLISGTLNANNLDFNWALGLGKHLKKVQKASFEKKRFYVESATTAIDAWTKNCSGKDKAETLINAALERLDTAKTEYTVVAFKWQDIFLKNGASVDEFEKVFLESAEGKILLECIVTPRNHAWLPKFKERLETKGDPVTFLVGMSHIGGSDGLLSLLRKEGYTDIKRIYAFE